MNGGRLAIVGYGLLGRLLAWRARREGFDVTVYEKLGPDERTATSFMAAGMIAPFSEMESSEPLIFELGMAALELWPQWIRELPGDQCQLSKKGSLIIAHPRDRALWNDFLNKTCRFAKEGQYQELAVQEIEHELSPTFQKGLYFPLEMHIDPRLFLIALQNTNEKLGVKVKYHQQPSLLDHSLQKLQKEFDWLIDCRGIGSSEWQSSLRGVRGEALLVHAPDVLITRPIRVLHPRYAVYIVPREGHTYYLGATQIESESLRPITIRSTLELLSAAFVVHPGFAEATVIDSFVGLRPAYGNHTPQIHLHGNLLVANGLFRHGYLLAPIVTQTVIDILTNQNSQFQNDLFFAQGEIR